MRLDDFAVPEDAKQWLVKALGGETFSSETLDALEAKRDLTRAQRDLIAGMQLSRQGNLRGADTVVMGSDGVQRGSELQAPLRAAASMLHGLAELESRVREQMPVALVGQHHLQAAFEKMAAAHESVVRRPAPLMTLVGPPGHGKDEAIGGYTKALFGDEAKPLSIDVSSFDKPDELQKAIAEAVEALPEGGVVRFTGVEDLAAQKPKHANVLLAHLSAHRADPSEPRISYFLDFDATDKAPRQATTAALSAMGNRLLSAEGGFCLLDAEAMRIYAKRLLPELMSLEGMEQLRLDWTPEALELLGEFLATPHAPLIDLEQRLTESVLIAVSVRKSVDPRDVVRIDVSRPVAKDQALKAELLSALHEEAPDYFKAEELFTSLVVANQGIDLERESQIAKGHDNLAQLLEQATAAVPGTVAKNASAAKKDLTAMIASVFQKATTYAKGISDAAAHCIDENRQVVVPPALRKKFLASLEELLGSDLGHVAKEPLIRAALTTAAVGWGLPVTSDLALMPDDLAKGAKLKLKAGTEALVVAALDKGVTLSGDGVVVDNETDSVADHPWNQAFLPDDQALQLLRVSAEADVQVTLQAVKDTAPKKAAKPAAKDKADAQGGEKAWPAGLDPKDGEEIANALGGALKELLGGALGALGGADGLKKPVGKPKNEPVKPAEPVEPVEPAVVAVAANAVVDLGDARVVKTFEVPVGADGWARLRANAVKQDVVRVGNETDGTLYTREGSAPTPDKHKSQIAGFGKTRFGSERGEALNIGVYAPGQPTAVISVEKVGTWLAWEDVNVGGQPVVKSFACAKGDSIRVALNRNDGVSARAVGIDAKGKRHELEIKAGMVDVPFAGTLELELSARGGGSCKLFVEKLFPDL